MLSKSEVLSTGKLARNRWNVIDLITTFADKTRPAFLISDVDVTAAEKLRSQLASRGIRITITAILLKAISIVQIMHPMSRSFRLASGRLFTSQTPIAGITVERNVGDEPVVFFAVIPEAHSKTLGLISQELEQYRDSPISEVHQLSKELFLTKLPWIIRQIGIWIGHRLPHLRCSINPSTFGLTSLGKLGTQMLLGPNVTTCVFGVGKIEPRPTVSDDGKLEIRRMMTLTLSVDTAVMNICDAAYMMKELKELVDNGLADYLDASEQADENCVDPLSAGFSVSTSNLRSQSRDRPDCAPPAKLTIDRN